MPINVKGLFETLQYKANNIDSSTSTAEILDTLKAIQRTDGNTIISYDSDGALPDATTTNIKLAYVKNTGIVKFNNGIWDTLTGSLSGEVIPYTFQGSVSGYNSGGIGPSNVIDKFPFAVDANATDVGDLTVGRYFASGQSSTTHGYTSATYATSANSNTEKFSFAAGNDAAITGNLTGTAGTRRGTSGQSSETNGYTTGGYVPMVNIIDKFSFTVDGDATDVGDMTVTKYVAAGQSSTDNGYTSGGFSPPAINVIDKFPFSTDTNATDVGDLTAAKYRISGQSSTTHGYVAGGGFPGALNVIEKFPFSVDANSTDVGDLTVNRGSTPGPQSSTTHGYASGGSPTTNIIDKFPFSVDANATDVGDLTVARYGIAGQQV